jgi:uncharacterized protein (DUF983 family)
MTTEQALVSIPSIPMATAILRGLRARCPHCGEGKLFRGYLKPVANCAVCGEAYSHIRADDFPPWLTIIIVGHVLVPMLLMTEHIGMSLNAELLLWLPVTLLSVVALLPFTKGAIIGLMWSLALTDNETP